MLADTFFMEISKYQSCGSRRRPRALVERQSSPGSRANIRRSELAFLAQYSPCCFLYQQLSNPLITN